ncbi:MAG: flavin-dependent dehydrogenase [Gloeocapsa sp. DLM2.Bin57]|nr:MAG: flavin-dependent dehydrogenase [Gloeocapsa sp. DLM2.Bin57]
MKQLLYIEIPTPDPEKVINWLQKTWQPLKGLKKATSAGVLVELSAASVESNSVLSIFVWSLQRTTYLKVFRYAQQKLPNEGSVIKQLTQEIRAKFPYQSPQLPVIDLAQKSIFDALAPYYPETVKYFQKMPRGEFYLNRVYWWEKRWREQVENPTQPKQVIFANAAETNSNPEYDLIYLGGALGSIHAAVMARKGYRVLLVERLPFGKMNREWNISRDEIKCLIDLNLLTSEEVESLIAREYKDGFNKFFDANNPPHLKAKVLHTPTVLNLALDAEKLLKLCGEKLIAAGGTIWDETEFVKAYTSSEQVLVELVNLGTKETKKATGRVLVDAMGSASPIAWQLNGDRTFDSVCPTVGAVIESGFEPQVWDSNYGDVLNSHGDISRGRQLIWELFPGEGKDLTIYLFHYHQVHKDNPGSLLEMYEDFFNILPEYKRCDLDKLVWKKPTFGYIPGHFSVSSQERRVAFDRLVLIGDSASLQSPLIFTGFGSLVRNLGRLTVLLDTALNHDFLSAKDLDLIRAYQSNVAVTWLFSKGMMVPTGKSLPPARINAMLNTFFGLLADEPPQVADTFIKDRTDWWTFTRLALKAAQQNPILLWWIVEMAGFRDLWRWLLSYLLFTLDAGKNWLLGGSFTPWLKQSRVWLEKRFPALWFRLLCFQYSLRRST